MFAAEDQTLTEAPLTPPLALPPETLKARVADLVRDYVTGRSPELARRIVHYSSALALHPGLRDAPDECNAFCRLSRHWRLVAAQDAAPAAT